MMINYFHGEIVTFKRIQKLGVATHACIQTLGRLRQEDHKFKLSLGYIGRFISKQKQEIKRAFTIWFKAGA
jgi:hypothetical protein